MYCIECKSVLTTQKVQDVQRFVLSNIEKSFGLIKCVVIKSGFYELFWLKLHVLEYRAGPGSTHPAKLV